MVQLQTGNPLHLARAVMLAICGDFPVARKTMLTGSACVQYFVPQGTMEDVDNGKAARAPRTHRAMPKRKRILLLMSTTGTTGCKERALKKARSAGMDLHFGNGVRGSDDNWVFGPDPALDNVHLNIPQVSLHGMDEGLTSELNLGCLRAVILELVEMPGEIKWSKAGFCFQIRNLNFTPPHA